jgi:hypothetical protein
MMMFFWDITVSIFSPEGGDNMFLQNTDIYLWAYVVSQNRRTMRTSDLPYG